MFDRLNFKEKPLKERFLLILGLATFVGFMGLGLMVMFWDKLPLNMNNTQRYLFGGVIIIYSVLRFSRLLTKK